MEAVRRNARQLDIALIGVLLLLGAYSCLALLAATHGKANGGVPTHVLGKQIMFLVLGLVAMAVVAVFDYRLLQKWRWWIYGVSVFMMLGVLAMPARFGAHSWIPLGPLSFQPSEFGKLALIVGIAAYMAHIDDNEYPDYRFVKTFPVWLMFILPFGLTLKEPALGQALVMFAITMTMLTVYVKRWQFTIIILFVLIIVVGFSVVALQYPVQAQDFIQNILVKHHILKDYQAQRIISWLNPKYSLLHYGYNVHQAQIAVGSGQVFGEGLFNGIETSGGWIPNQWNDYIFTAIGEEFGFVGSSLLVLLFVMLIYRLTKIAATSSDTFGTYLIMGIVGMFGFQIFENIGMDMYLSPSTGITLPFISYGGSSLVANFVAVGLAISVGLRRKRLRFI